MLLKTLFKHRKKIAMLSLAVMALKSFDKNHKDSEDVIEAKKLLETNGYKITKVSKSAASMNYVKQLYQDNPQLIEQLLKLAKKFGKI